MKKSLLLALTLAVGINATAMASNPFSDLPAGHWAYASVAQLAAAGVVEGYPDGTFQGDKLMTRYEMAQIVAKALAKGAIGADNSLVSEFAEELNSLGVRVAKLEKNADNVKITGEVRAKYFHSNKSTFDGSNHEAELRSRLWLTGAINDNWHYTGMLQNTQDFTNDDGDGTTAFKRAYLEGKIGAATVTAGRYHAMLAEGLVMDADDDAADGIDISLGQEDKVTFGASYGKVKLEDSGDNAKYWGVHANAPLSENFGVHAGYYDLHGVNNPDSGFAFDEGYNVWNAGFNLGRGDLNFTADYLKGSKKDFGDKNNGYALGLSYKEADPEKVGSYTIFANYWDQPSTTFFLHTTDAYTGANGSGFKGWGIGAGYTVMKNAVLTVAYFDTQDKKDNAFGAKVKDKRIWTDLTITF